MRYLGTLLITVFALLFLLPFVAIVLMGPVSMIFCEGWSIILHGHGDLNRCLDVWGING